MKDELKGRLIAAIENMRVAKGCYKMLADVYYDEEERKRVYTRLYSQFMGSIHSATDILLNVFVDEKGIRVNVADPKNGRPRTPNTVDLCEMVVKHNLEHEDNQYLTGVDFSVLCDKKDGNENVHNGIVKDMQDMHRLFLNYNKVLLSLDCNEDKEIVELESDIEKFDFQAFQGYFDLDEEEAEDRRFILLADSLHDIDELHLATFLQLPWAAIIDFDGISEMGGLGNAIRTSGIERNAYNYQQAIDSNATISFYNKIMHINACDTSKKATRFLSGNNYNRNDSKMVNKVCEKLHDSAHPYVTIVIVGNVTRRINTICADIAYHFKETKILILSEQSDTNQNIPLSTSDDELEYSDSVISEVQVFNSSIHSMMSCIYDNRALLPVVDNYLFSEENAYRMPKCNPIERNQFSRFENELELIHLGLGKKLEEQNDNAFFRGDLISWGTIRNKCTAPIITERKFIDFVASMKLSKGHKCFYVYHRPGFGGTTLGRQLIWELHTTTPCVRIKRYQGIDWLKRTFNDLYKMFGNSLFWLLIDQNDINSGDIEEIEYEVEKGDYNVCALVVRRVDESFAIDRSSKRSKNELVLRLLEQDAKDMLESKCKLIVDDDTVFYQRRQNLLSNLKSKEECPLIVNLYLLEDDFKLDTYIKSRIETIPNDADKEKVCRILAFSAMGSYFSNIKFPASYFRQYLGQKNIENEKKCFDGILLKRKENDETRYFVNHYLIAEELLAQLLPSSEGENWKSNLPRYSKLLIDWLFDLMGNVEYIDDGILDIICSLFTDKTRGSELQHKEDNDVRFTKLFHEMDKPPRIDVICYLADRMSEKIFQKIPRGEGRKEYGVLAHIYAQQAKIRLWTERINESSDQCEDKDVELNRYIAQTTELINSEGIRDKVLEDILARCSLKRAKDLRGFLGNDISAEDLNKILAYVDDSIYHFRYSIWYGSCDYGVPGKIEAYAVGLSSIVLSRHISEKNRIEKLYADEVAVKYIDEAIEAIRDLEEYELTDFAKALSQKYRVELLSDLYPEEPSDLLQRLDSIRCNAASDDYETQYFVSNQIVYAYERKYYNPDGYRGSELIKRALEGDKKAIADADRAFDNLQSVIRMNVNHPVSSVTYKRWFEYAKYKDVPLEIAKSVARAWRDSVNNGGRRNAASSIQPYYYLFVITLLQYISGTESVSSEDVYVRKADLKNVLRQNVNHSHAVIDWYSTGKGLGKLYSREWIDIKDVSGEKGIAVVSGKVVHLDEKYVGYMRITNPAGFSKWSKSQLGYGYNTDTDVRFKEEQTTIISPSDVGTDKEWKFKFGFTYENFELSMNSLEMLGNEHKLAYNKTITAPLVVDADKVVAKPSFDIISMQDRVDDISESQIFVPKYISRDAYGNAALIIGDINGERAAIHRKGIENQHIITGDVEEFMESVVEKYRKQGLRVTILSKTDKGINCAIYQSGCTAKNDTVDVEEASVKTQESEIVLMEMPEGTVVQFYPKEFKPKVVRGEVNGVMASMNKKSLDYVQKSAIIAAINSGSSIRAEIVGINPQRTGYIVRW